MQNSTITMYMVWIHIEKCTIIFWSILFGKTEIKPIDIVKQTWLIDKLWHPFFIVLLQAKLSNINRGMFNEQNSFLNAISYHLSSAFVCIFLLISAISANGLLCSKQLSFPSPMMMWWVMTPWIANLAMIS